MTLTLCTTGGDQTTNGSTTTGSVMTTPLHTGRPEALRALLSALRNAAGVDATLLMVLAMLVAALDDATSTVNATATPLCSRWRRVTSVAPVMFIAEEPTPSVADKAPTNAVLWVALNVLTVSPASVEELRTV